MKIYWAAPLFNLAEIVFNRTIADRLRSLKHVVHLPQEHEPRSETGWAIFKADVAAIDACDVVVALLDGADPDSGTCWECGYAYAKGKPVLVVRTDTRSGDDPRLGACNLMMWQGCADRLRAVSPKTVTVDCLAAAIDVKIRHFAIDMKKKKPSSKSRRLPRAA